MRKLKNIEYKQKITNSFLKTVSAFANYGNGQILFGVCDNGEICGIENPIQACLDIENKINDNINPVPYYTLEINDKTSVITLNVMEGMYKPYFYKSKAYIRNDSSTIEVNRLELTRLILEGQNISFEECKAKKQDLSFCVLSKKLENKLNLSSINLDTLKTLELYDDKNGYNNAAELLADTNTFPGIDIVRFRNNINIILDRVTFSNESILSQYDKTIEIFNKYYCYEEIKGAFREKKELIPEACFREAIANALVHRTWDINAHITISMFDDHIEITSPGGLPKGISEEEYLDGGISIPRNYIICNVFMRLQMIERFGTGIRRIKEFYKTNEAKPTFNLTSNRIQIVLPIFNENNNLSEDPRKIYELLKKQSMSSSSIMKATGFGKTKVVAILNQLIQDGYIRKTGTGKATRYSV
ncbi:RNA-binding domain-containing protein [Floccifex sp.]|uniref:RNA-binding domain-containing protein n=1 Tax=Floccifex sp. TaxID=2815810 RepID=UPI003F02E609